MYTIVVALMLQAAPTADEIIGRYVARAEETAEFGARLKYMKIRTEYDVTDPAKPRQVEKRESVVWTEHGHVMETTVAINNGPVLTDGPDESALSLDKSFGGRFKFDLIQPEPNVCSGCYLMSFKALPKQPPRRSIEEDVLSHTSGRLLVDVDNGVILWLRGAVEQFRKAWGIGKIYDGDVEMSQRMVFGAPMVVSARVRVHYREFFSERNRLFELSFFGFEVRPESPSP
ncbi:MAG TPA: hypothetical protein VMJ72_01810 [Candidatus Paceibacterota bacterium]|nr:hypothetical protein [Candidatus Paceibacterota bacterium]